MLYVRQVWQTEWPEQGILHRWQKWQLVLKSEGSEKSAAVDSSAAGVMSMMAGTQRSDWRRVHGRPEGCCGLGEGSTTILWVGGTEPHWQTCGVARRQVGVIGRVGFLRIPSRRGLFRRGYPRLSAPLQAHLAGLVQWSSIKLGVRSRGSD